MTASQHRCQPAHAVRGQGREVRLVDVADVDVAPQAHQARDTVTEPVGMDGQRCGVDRARRGSADDAERTCCRRAQDACDGTQRADLVRGARTASGEDDPGTDPRAAECGQARYSARSVRSRISSIAAVAPQM